MIVLLFAFVLFIQSNNNTLSYINRNYINSIKYKSFLTIKVLEDTSNTIFKDAISTFIEKKSRPQPVIIKRNRMELPFAVQLMRTSYNTVDELDFVPMDIFQKQFFLFRQSEWEDYKRVYSNIIQGDLADPSYFDFISYCQYAVISDRIKSGQTNFIERIGAEGEAIVVTRNSNIKKNEDIPYIHSNIVGNKLLRFIEDTYSSDLTLRGINSTKGDPNSFNQVAQEVLDLLTINSYSNSSQIQQYNVLNKFDLNDKNSFIFKITLKSPVNLWSQQVLRYRNDKPINDFENKILEAVADRMGFSYRVISTDISNKKDLNYIIKISII